MACALAPLFCLFSVLWTSDAHAIRDGYLSGKPTVIPVSAHASRATRFDRVGIAEACNNCTSAAKHFNLAARVYLGYFDASHHGASRFDQKVRLRRRIGEDFGTCAKVLGLRVYVTMWLATSSLSYISLGV